MLAIGGVIAWTVVVDEGVSRDADEWRNATSPHFQNDFKPGVVK